MEHQELVFYLFPFFRASFVFIFDLVAGATLQGTYAFAIASVQKEQCSPSRAALAWVGHCVAGGFVDTSGVVATVPGKPNLPFNHPLCYFTGWKTLQARPSRDALDIVLLGGDAKEVEYGRTKGS